MTRDQIDGTRVACPVCKALPNSPCVALDGEPFGAEHVERLETTPEADRAAHTVTRATMVSASLDPAGMGTISAEPVDPAWLLGLAERRVSEGRVTPLTLTLAQQVHLLRLAVGEPEHDHRCSRKCAASEEHMAAMDADADRQIAAMDDLPTRPGGVGPESVGHTVVARTVQGDLHGGGKVIAYTDAATVVIERADKSALHWRADLCDPVPPPLPYAGTCEHGRPEGVRCSICSGEQ